MAGSNSSVLLDGFNWISILTFALGVVLGFLSKIGVLLTKHFLDKKKEDDNFWRARKIQECIIPCLDWISIILEARTNSNVVNPFHSCYPNTQLLKARSTAKEYLRIEIYECLKEAIRVVKGLGANPHSTPKISIEQEEVLSRLETLKAELLWWQNKLFISPCPSKWKLSKLRKKANKIFKYEKNN